MVQNLTEGKPLPLLFAFALPMVLGNLFQQLYTMVDTIVVGQFVGEDAVAAVGSSFPLVFLAVAMSTGISMGANVVVSQLFGAGRIKEVKSTVTTALITLSALGLFIFLLGELISGPVLRLLGTDPDVFADSLLYLQIYFGGTLFLYLYNALNGIYNALGNSWIPLIFLMASALLNIALDLLFVIRFHWGVAGVAWATLISQGLCAIISLVVMLVWIRRTPNEPEASPGRRPLFQREAVVRIAKIGLPSMFQQSLVSISMLLMQNLVNSYGKVFVAGYSAATKIDSLCLMPNMNFANAMSSYTAQNLGAEKPERIKEGYRATLLMAAVFSLTIVVLIFLFGDVILSLFLNQGGGDGSALSYGVEYMQIVSLFYMLMGALFVTNGLLRGAGDMRSFVMSSFSNLGSRIAFAYLLAPYLGHSSIAWSIPLGWAVGVTVSQVRYRSGAWKHRNVIRKQEGQITDAAAK